MKEIEERIGFAKDALQIAEKGAAIRDAGIVVESLAVAHDEIAKALKCSQFLRRVCRACGEPMDPTTPPERHHCDKCATV